MVKMWIILFGKSLLPEGIKPWGFNTGVCLVCEVSTGDAEAVARTQRKAPSAHCAVFDTVRGTKQKGHHSVSFLFCGDSYGSRTHDCSVRGCRLDHLTNEPFVIVLDYYTRKGSVCQYLFKSFLKNIFLLEKTRFLVF